MYQRYTVCSCCAKHENIYRCGTSRHRLYEDAYGTGRPCTTVYARNCTVRNVKIWKNKCRLRHCSNLCMEMDTVRHGAKHNKIDMARLCTKRRKMHAVGTKYKSVRTVNSIRYLTSQTTTVLQKERKKDGTSRYSSCENVRGTFLYYNNDTADVRSCVRHKKHENT